MASTKDRLGPVVDEGFPNRTINQFDLDRLFPTEQPPIENTALPDPVVLKKAAAATEKASREISITAARPGEAEPWVLGRCQAKGKIIAGDDSGVYLVLDHLWSVGECEELEGMYFDGVFEGLATQLGNNEHWTGEASQTASAILTALKGSYDTLDGKAHSVLSYLPAFSMNVKMGMKGIKFYDPRQSPQGYYYSANPALALAHVLVAAGYTMNWDSVATAANYCDEIIGATSPQTKRWEIGGQILDRADLKVWLKTLATYANCFIDKIGSEVYLIPDEPRSPNHTITADDMIAGTVRVSRPGSRNVPTVVTVYGTSFDGEPIEYSYPPDTEAEPGSKTELRMPFFQSVHACGRKAEEVYRNAQDGLELEFVGFDKGLQRTIGDVGTITNAAFGLSSVPMTLIEHYQVGRGRWYSKYSKYTAYHSDTVYTATFNDTSFYDPYRPPDGPTPTVEEVVDEDLSGNQFSRLKVTFEPDDWAYGIEFRVVVTSTLAGDFDPVILDERIPNTYEDSYTVYTDRARVGVEYEAKVYVVSHTHDQSATAGSATATPVFQPDPDILWDSTPIFATRITKNTTSFLDLYFAYYDTSYGDKTGCEFQYHDHMLTNVPVIARSFSTNEFLVKWEMVQIVSGSGYVQIEDAADKAGVWYDLYDQIIDQNDTTNDGIAEHCIIDVTIAKNDGNDNPVEGTQRTKRVTFYAYRGDSPYVVEDQFNGTNGTAITSHNPDTDEVGTGWVVHAGGFEIQGNDLEGNSTNNRAVIDSGTNNCAITAVVEYGDNSVSPMTTANLGLIGRAQDASNYWFLVVENAASENPVLSLYLYTAGSPSLKAQRVMTGEGPLGDDLFQAIRLAFNDTSIVGTVTVNSYLAVYEVRYTSSSLQEETLHGIYAAADSVPDNFQRFYITRIGTQPPDPRILWSEIPISSVTTFEGSFKYEGISFLPTNFIGPAGTSDCYYQVDDVTENSVSVIGLTSFSPNVVPTGEFIVSYEIVDSNSTVYANYSPGSEGTWYELVNLTLTVYDDTANGVANYAVIDVTVATNNGSGAPIPGTSVTKRVSISLSRTA